MSNPEIRKGPGGRTNSKGLIPTALMTCLHHPTGKVSYSFAIILYTPQPHPSDGVGSVGGKRDGDSR